MNDAQEEQAAQEEPPKVEPWDIVGKTEDRTSGSVVSEYGYNTRLRSL